MAVLRALLQSFRWTIGLGDEEGVKVHTLIQNLFLLVLFV